MSGMNAALEAMLKFQDSAPGKKTDLGTVRLNSCVFVTGVKSFYLPGIIPGVVVPGLRVAGTNILSGGELQVDLALHEPGIQMTMELLRGMRGRARAAGYRLFGDER